MDLVEKFCILKEGLEKYDVVSLKGMLIGILGGMGPLASAAFVATLYEKNRFWKEQDAPTVFLLSQPDIVDRTEAILSGMEDVMLPRVVDGVRRLVQFGAEQVIIACLTSHAVLCDFPDELKQRLVSLVDVTIDAVAARRTPCLLLSSTGARHARVFTNHERWKQTRGLAVVPDDKDQSRIHEMIYVLKRGGEPSEAFYEIKGIVNSYGLPGFIAGCTEFHLVTRYMMAHVFCGLEVIDPLLTLAERFALAHFEPGIRAKI